jgi:hypothetical protein
MSRGAADVARIASAYAPRDHASAEQELDSGVSFSV